MKSQFLTLFTLFIPLTFAIGAITDARADDFAAADPYSYNSLQWNRRNAMERNGIIDRGDWYEWWYYKVVLPESQKPFYFIYGVVNPWDTDNSRAVSRSYVSFGSFSDAVMVEQDFSIRDFAASYDRPFVQIAENTATDHALSARIHDSNNNEIAWDLNLESEWSFNAMGWTMFVDAISNIFWYPAQASARMNGWIEFKGERISVRNAPAYQDRNWGRSFPKWWTWLVANQFKNSPGTVLAGGGGRPKIFEWIDIKDGLSFGLRHQGREHLFRNVDGNEITADIQTDSSRISVEVVATKGNIEKLVIVGTAPKESFMPLKFMTPQGELFIDYEALLGNIRVQLFEWKWITTGSGPGWYLVADLETDEGGIEYGSFDYQN